MQVDDGVQVINNNDNNIKLLAPNENSIAEQFQNMLEWRNEAIKKIKKAILSENEYDKFANAIFAVEEKWATYLRQNDKEWHYSDIRANWVRIKVEITN